MQIQKLEAVESQRNKILCRAKKLADDMESANRLSLLVADLKIKELGAHGV